MTEFPRRSTVEADDCVEFPCVPKDVIHSFVAPIDGGDILFHHAGILTIGHVDGRIAIMVAQRGCRCGCGAPGRGLVTPLAADEARDFAEMLLKLAGEQEAHAAASAAAALAKVAGE